MIAPHTFMAGRRNQPDKLLQLLEEAAGRLKTVQADLERERSKSASLASEVESLKKSGLKRAMLITLPERTRVPNQGTPSADKTAVASVEEALLETRNRGLHEELNRVRDELAALKVGDGSKTVAMAPLNDSARARSTEELAAARAEVETLQRALEDARAALAETAAKLNQLEGEMALLRARRDDLNVELARVEGDRKAARTRIAELEVQASTVQASFEQEMLAAVGVEHSLRSDAGAALVKEREKHQSTAQKLIEARGKIREVEQANANLTNRVIDVDGQLARRENEWVSKCAVLESQAAGLQNQLRETTTEWRHVERQYESLHKEMLTLLDQRDEARRELQALKSR